MDLELAAILLAMRIGRDDYHRAVDGLFNGDEAAARAELIATYEARQRMQPEDVRALLDAPVIGVGREPELVEARGVNYGR